ncbi:MAG: hypothetical protein ACTSWX_00985 [Promethearchaeota archaeon]
MPPRKKKRKTPQKQEIKQWIGFFILLVMVISAILAYMLIGK